MDFCHTDLPCKRTNYLSTSEKFKGCKNYGLALWLELQVCFPWGLTGLSCNCGFGFCCFAANPQLKPQTGFFLHPHNIAVTLLQSLSYLITSLMILVVLPVYVSEVNSSLSPWLFSLWSHWEAFSNFPNYPNSTSFICFHCLYSLTFYLLQLFTVCRVIYDFLSQVLEIKPRSFHALGKYSAPGLDS